MSNLVAFAGRHSAVETKRENAYERFRSGADTAQIAAYYRMSEATVLRWITMERCCRRGLAEPYERVQGVRGSGR